MFGKTIATAVTALFALTAAAWAQSPTRIEQFDAWGAYSYDSAGGKVCYVLSVPISSAPTNVDHGDIFFLISQRPGQNVSYEPQAMMGYPLQESSKITVNVDGREFHCSAAATRAGSRTRPGTAARRRDEGRLLDDGQGDLAPRHRHLLQLFAQGRDRGAQQDRQLQ
jgi:hypothetical protein